MCEVALPPAREPIEQRGRQHGDRNAFVDRGEHGPPPLAGVRHATREVLEPRAPVQGLRGEVEQPRADDAAAAPHLSDRSHVQLVAEALGMRERGGLGVGGALRRAGSRVLQQVEPLRVRGHQPVLDAVVYHLDEVAGARRPAVQVAELRRAGLAVPFGRAWRQGTTDVALGVAGLPPLRDLRGTRDASGRELLTTQIAVADEIAGAGELVLGKASGIPAARVRGLDLRGDGRGVDLVMPRDRDLFR